MHGLISKISICYWQDQPDYYRLSLFKERVCKVYSVLLLAARLFFRRFQLPKWLACTSIICILQRIHDQLAFRKVRSSFSHEFLQCRSEWSSVKQLFQTDTHELSIVIHYHSDMNTTSLESRDRRSSAIIFALWQLAVVIDTKVTRPQKPLNKRYVI